MLRRQIHALADDIAGAQWLVCTPQNVVVKRGDGHGFSACAYFFGRELHKELKVPIGLIAASVGGCSQYRHGRHP